MRETDSLLEVDEPPLAQNNLTAYQAHSGSASTVSRSIDEQLPPNLALKASRTRKAGRSSSTGTLDSLDCPRQHHQPLWTDPQLRHARTSGLKRSRVEEEQGEGEEACTKSSSRMTASALARQQLQLQNLSNSKDSTCLTATLAHMAELLRGKSAMNPEKRAKVSSCHILLVYSVPKP
jgi:hypothetical protein